MEHVDGARMELFCRENKAMEIFHQHQMTYCSMSKEPLIKLVFGLLVKILNRKGLHQSLGDGNGMNVEKNGFLFGPPSQSFQHMHGAGKVQL